MADVSTTLKIQDAISYIKESAFYSEGKFDWIKPLIDKVIKDDYYKRNIDEILTLIFPDFYSESAPKEGEVNETVESIIEPRRIALKKITSVENLSNIGLLTHEAPIRFKDGLNVFFGANASGKSSLYLSICKAVGKVNKKVFPNIHGASETSSCRLNYEDTNKENQSIEWVTGKENQELDVMIFDSQIANYLIEADQQNEFKIAHLKAQYFKFLQEMFVDVENRLSELCSKNESNILNSETLLREKMGIGFDQAINIPKEKLEAASFSDEQKSKLIELEKLSDTLSRSSVVDVTKNLESCLEKAEKVLKAFANCADEKSKKVWENKYTKEYVEKLKNDITDYQIKKNALQSKETLNKYLKQDWINNKDWVAFISQGITFAQSLDEEERKKLEETCLYCQQPLSTNASKELLAGYRKLQEQLSTQLKANADVIQSFRNGIEQSVQTLEEIKELNLGIEREFQQIGKTNLITSNEETVKPILSNLDKCILEEKVPSLTGDDFTKLEAFVSEYSQICSLYSEKIIALNETTKTKDEKIKECKEEITKLEISKAIVEQKNELLKLLKFKDLKKRLEDKKNLLSDLKRQRSARETTFSREESMKIFQTRLGKEYEMLGFQPTEKWNIKTATPGGVNKRVYNMGNRRLSEIFSEAEKKIHSLADFFAQGEVNQFEGAYVFDDPVTSLDEYNIDAVSERIKKLVSEGHQVVVFTHNLFFLNSLVDPVSERITRLRKYETTVFVDNDIFLDNENSMKATFEKVDTQVKKLKAIAESGQDVPVLDMRTVYSLMSGYLEDFVEKVIMKNVISRYRPNIRMSTVEDLGEINKEKLRKASALYSKTSRYGSRHSQPLQQPPPIIAKLSADFLEFDQEFNLKKNNRINNRTPSAGEG